MSLKGWRDGGSGLGGGGVSGGDNKGGRKWLEIAKHIQNIIL